VRIGPLWAHQSNCVFLVYAGPAGLERGVGCLERDLPEGFMDWSEGLVALNAICRRVSVGVRRATLVGHPYATVPAQPFIGHLDPAKTLRVPRDRQKLSLGAEHRFI